MWDQWAKDSHRQTRGLWVPRALFLPPNNLWMAVVCLGTLDGYAAATTIHLSIHLSIHYFTHLSVFPPSHSVIIYQLMLLTIPPSHSSRVLPPAQSSIQPSTVAPSHHPSIHPPRNPSTHPSYPYSMITMVISTNSRPQGRRLVQRTQNSDFLHLLVTTLHHPVYTSSLDTHTHTLTHTQSSPSPGTQKGLQDEKLL